MSDPENIQALLQKLRPAENNTEAARLERANRLAAIKSNEHVVSRALQDLPVGAFIRHRWTAIDPTEADECPCPYFYGVVVERLSDRLNVFEMMPETMGGSREITSMMFHTHPKPHSIERLA
jgi:hypothetical protein